MPADPTEDTYAAGIEQLEYFGLSTYAAKTYLALVSLGTATARDVAQASEVPRTRVYDAVDELHDRGLVDVQHSTPKEFWAISVETMRRSFEQEFQNRADILQTVLDEIEPAQLRSEQSGVWTVNGAEAVTARVIEFIGTAEDEIIYMTVEELLTDEVVAALNDAAARGVSIKLGGVSGEVKTSIEDEIPEAELFESLWVWSDTPAGRLMMVDRRKTLVSALVNGADKALTDPRVETAIWGEGDSNSLVVVLRAIFTWRLDSQNGAG